MSMSVIKSFLTECQFSNYPFSSTQGAPGPPGEPFISRHGAALTLHWTSGDQGRSPITRYVIEARPSGERLTLRLGDTFHRDHCCSWSMPMHIHVTLSLDEGLWDILIKDIPKEVTSYTLNLDMLREGVTYDFRVIAVNDYGYGSPSAPSPSISGLYWRFTIVCMTFFSYLHIKYSCEFYVSSPESFSILRGVVVPGGDCSGGPHLHTPPCFHPHHPRPE